jgi:hypothetical protein
MELQQVMQTLNSRNGLKNVMMQPAFEDEDTGHTFSQAELIADVVNILRMDTKRMAEQHDVDVSIQKMTPERAAELLQGVAQGEDLGIGIAAILLVLILRNIDANSSTNDYDGDEDVEQEVDEGSDGAVQEDEGVLGAGGSRGQYDERTQDAAIDSVFG